MREGVLVTLADEHPEVPYGFRAIVMDNPNFPNDENRATLKLGEHFTDAARGIQIDVTDRVGDSLVVRIRYSFPPPGRPDPQIIPWGNPPYSTPDIWLDSEKNGWGTFRYTDGSGNAVGQGDVAWVNHVNRVYVRVRNLGAGNAAGVRVDVYQNNPPGFGQDSPNWAFLGQIFIPSLPAGGVSTNYVNWTPTVGQHTCLRAVIEPYAGELLSTNNSAQENIALFETSPGSPYSAVSSTMNVFNNSHIKDTFTFDVRGVPAGWKWYLEPRSLTILPGNSAQVTLKVMGPDPTKSNRKLDQVGNTAIVTVTAMKPFKDTLIPIGATETWLAQVWKSTLTMQFNIVTGQQYFSGSMTRPKPLPVIGINSALIGIEILGPNAGDRHFVFTTTDEVGNFFFPISKVDPTGKPLGKGNYSATAYFDGSYQQHSAQSALVKFTIN